MKLWLSMMCLILAVPACGGSPEAPIRAASPAPTLSDGTVVSGCAMRVRDELETGVGDRVVRVGPSAFVAFGLHVPRGARPGAVSNFKVMVELRPDAKVTVSLPTEAQQFALLFDRGRTRTDNAFTLADGARTVRFQTCPGRPTTFVGAVATTGPTQAPLDVTVEGQPARRITLTAFARP